MQGTHRRLAAVTALLLLTSPALLLAQEKPAAKKRPHADSRTPYVHRIQIRDEQDNPITLPKAPPAGAAAAADAKKPETRLLSLATTCGKCHDYPTINTGWHFNAPDPSVPAGRPGEPWFLTDDAVPEDPRLGPTSVANTRTQLPLSYRNWPGTWRPADVGMNDWKFSFAFGRHWPAGGPMEKSTAPRFNVTGALQNDCLVCHLTDNSYDLNARYEQIVKKQNFKYAPLVAAGVGAAEKSREKLKDTWTPADGPAEPSFDYDPGRFDPTSHITFNLSRRVPNERRYSCHTSLDFGKSGTDDLAQRWRHDGDIHLVKGMLCVDCHRHGLDHKITRNYEGEAQERNDPNIATLSCEGCHYGAEGTSGRGLPVVNLPVSLFEPAAHGRTTGTDLGGRNAAPRPVHKGLPTLHFEKLACTACHAGPYPGPEASAVLTSMAHRLGTESYNRLDAAAPGIQEPVFLLDEHTKKITPNKILYPTFWGRMTGDQITPLTPETLSASKPVLKAFGPKPTLDLQPAKPLTEDEIVKILDAIAGMTPPETKAATKPTTGATSAPTPNFYTGEPVFITGGKSFKRDGKGKLTQFDNPAAKPYTWALAHDVRGAQQALGARGCTDCHSSGAPLFDSKVSSNALLVSANTTATMTDLRGDASSALAAFAATYPLRPILIATGYACAVILLLILIAYSTRALTSYSRKRTAAPSSPIL